jgi:hypothetical protein
MGAASAWAMNPAYPTVYFCRVGRAEGGTYRYQCRYNNLPTMFMDV